MLPLTHIAAACLLLASPVRQTLEPSGYTRPQHAGVVTEAADNTFAVRGRVTSEQALVIELGWLDVLPHTAYRAAYPVRGVAMSADANLYMMVREHPAREVKPHGSYHKTSIHNRALGHNVEDERKLTFTTRADTAALSVAVVVLALDGELRVGPFTLDDIDAEARAEYEQVMAEIRAAADARKPLVPRTLVFSRSQMKYGLERNYYHVWTDRPLFVNRAYRVPREHVTPFPSYQRILQEVVQYGIDGFAFFPETKDRMGMFDLTDRANVPGVRLLPEFIPTDSVETKLALLDAALQCESTVRIDGKVVITSYVAQALPPAQWADILAALRAKHGDSFIFLAALAEPASLRLPFVQGEPIAREKIEAARDHLRRYLDVADGIYFYYPAAFKNADRTFDEAFYREVFIPVFKSVLSEPKYQGKYLGLAAYHSHSNPDLSMGLLEDGTRTLRHSFEAAMDAKPDLIVLPEWDEVNENTCFRPTICNSTTTQRVMRQYMAKIKGESLTPLPDDDTSVPNLVLSTRKIVSLGETLVIELLNVPDEAESHAYFAQLSLLDERGGEVIAFDPVSFDSGALQEQRYAVATERWPAVRALVPVLAIKGYRGRDMLVDQGLPYTQVRATWNWDYKWVKQPLRELLNVDEAMLAWGYPCHLLGNVSCNEALALVEVIADGDEVYAVNDTSERLCADDDTEIFRIEYRSARSQEVEGEVALSGSDMQWIENLEHLHQGRLSQAMADGRLKLKGPVSPHVRWTCLAVPRERIDDAVLDVRLGDVYLHAPLREVMGKQMVAASGAGGLHVSVFPYRRMLDMPPHVGAKDAAFRVPVWPWIETEQYHLRVTGVSGKTWRSRPVFVVDRAKPQAAVKLRVFSGVERKPVDVAVDADRVPVMAYDFDPSRGAVLLTGAGKPFWASLGGFPDTTSGRGGRHSASMFRGDSYGYPSNASLTAPQWVTDDGEPALRFDGIGTFVHLPREALPRRSSFTFSFDIKPEVTKDAWLLLHRTHRLQSLGLSIKDGRLHAVHAAEGHVMTEVDTDLVVPVGVWSTVRVRYDFQTLQLSLGDRTFERAMTGPGDDMGPVVFGGFGATAGGFDEQAGNPGWFKGLMRGLRIAHRAE